VRLNKLVNWLLSNKPSLARFPYFWPTKNWDMDIDQFKQLNFEQKLSELKYNGNLLGSYERSTEQGIKVPGDIFELYDFWVYLSEDEKTIIPTRRNPLPAEEE
jgi:hypothetical protein